MAKTKTKKKAPPKPPKKAPKATKAVKTAAPKRSSRNALEENARLKGRVFELEAALVLMGDEVLADANDVNPEHYDGDTCMRQIAEQGGGRAFCLGTAYKYMYRHGRKAGSTAETDLAKAEWYLEWWNENGPKYTDWVEDDAELLEFAETLLGLQRSISAEQSG